MRVCIYKYMCVCVRVCMCVCVCVCECSKLIDQTVIYENCSFNICWMRHKVIFIEHLSYCQRLLKAAHFCILMTFMCKTIISSSSQWIFNMFPACACRAQRLGLGEVSQAYRLRRGRNCQGLIYDRSGICPSLDCCLIHLYPPKDKCFYFST